ncbi:hypothetical protein EFV37_22180 [Mesorhizobium loti]|uniref:Uncharacterized protein n=1 Tax=Mesorhizobium jarvisii TaxID=1777867 RepID=A0A6M7TLB2_9HYPH|nr:MULTISPECIES: hypothetical protein [Mesorhizobium]OBQ59570.1 hypothetical protein A9K72_25495 [Mesorhizobium loti]QKC64693.1 hypothetical protein EB229_22175 [Mesorhizobium jarvisii]QKD10607.1 hypothetical protein EFV37_22180 [Mesorhizobium loti]RJT30597.1 hypothetical protein D3242_24810 [Mesorhizobium jarvisii]
MGLKDCLISAVEQKAITREEASFLSDEFDQRFAQHRLSMGDDLAKAKARKDLEIQLKAEAAEARRRADLTEARRLGVKGYLQGYRGRDGKANVFEAAMGLLSHYGFRGASSVRGKTEAIIIGAQKNLDKVMFSFERKGLLGKRANRALQSDVVKELHGEAANDATAKFLAKSIGQVFEDLRQRFNAAGGAIGKIENFGLPHIHDRLKVKAAGRDAWKAEIRGYLDPSRMTNPLTGQALTPAGLDQALDHVWESIVSNGRAHLQPSMVRRGQGAIASQRQEERFLTFRDAASWMEYNAKFGKGDVVQAIFNHVNGMARDIAAMEVLGPNPAAMVEYMKQAVALEIGKLETGKPTLAKGATIFKDSQAKVAEYRIDSLWQALRGRPEVASGAARTTSNIKNVLTGTQLGSTVFLAAATDPFVARAARKLAGLPVTGTIMDMVKMVSKGNREDIISSGVMWEEYLHVMNDELRFAGPAVGSDWSRWIADRGVTFSGLQPLTVGRKLLEARAWQKTVADNAAKTFDKLDPRFRTALEGFGVTPAHWDIWRQAKDPAGFVTPRQIELNGGAVQYLDMRTAAPHDIAAEAKALAHRDASEKLAEVINSWSERSVPAGTPNARSLLTGKAERGTFGGELLDFLLQYKSFGLSFTALQLEAIGEMAATRGGGTGFRRSGMAYFAPMAIMLTLGGAAYLQIKSLLDFKKPEDMNPATNPAFWLKAGFQGGGFGLFGDFVKSTENRFGQSFQESIMGPGLAFVGDTAGLVLGNLQQAAAGEKVNPGRAARKYLQRYTPIVASNWLTRGIYNRLVLDNLQWLTDPEADKSFKAQIGRAKKAGTPYMIAPGQLTPPGR